MNKRNLRLAGVIIVIFALSALISYVIFGGVGRPATQPPLISRPGANNSDQSGQTTTTTTAQNQQGAQDNRTPFQKIFDPDPPEPGTTTHIEHWTTVFLRVTVRLALAALLTAALAFRPRKFAVLFKRNLFVAQTQILLAVVASALMMIVGDSAARAFGIFAAVSLVRFRTNIKDPKEITVLLVSLAVGLATGVGRWELAAILSLFVLTLLWALEYKESEILTRTMDLKVKTKNLVQTHEAIRDILKKHNFGSELRELDREDEDDPLGTVVFCVELSPLISTDELSAEILSSDQNNIDSIEWSQQKSANTYL